MYLTLWSGHKYLLLLVSLCAGVVCCQIKKDPDTNNPILASVFSKNLYYADVQDLLPSNSSEDSLVAINNIVNRWIKNTLLMREAEKNIPPDLNIEQLVNDYRESLILHNYEQMLVDKNLDTLISDDELQRYYEATKSQYILKYTIIKCIFIKSPEDFGQNSNIKDLLREDNPNIDDLGALIRQDDQVGYVANGQWHKALDIIELMPDNTIRISDLSKNKLFDISQGQHRYMMKVLAKVPASSEAPMSFIKEQITRIILHERKINLLESINARLYERALQNNNIKIYSE